MLLITIIIIIQLLFFFSNFSKEKNYDFNSPQIASFQAEIDSLKQIEIKRRIPKIYPFNPSFLSDYRGYQLGLSTQEIDRLLAHRKTGKYINSANEFQQVTKINDSLLKKIKPYFKFPDWVISRNKKNQSIKKNGTLDVKNNTISSSDEINFTTNDLNLATSNDLQKIHGIGEKLAERILKYRNKLKGYTWNEQLYEVWYLDKEVADRVLQRFSVQEKPVIEKININTAQFKEVLHLPYMDYKLTKKLFEYRDEMAEIQSLEELKNIDSFPLQNFDRISLYLKAE